MRDALGVASLHGWLRRMSRMRPTPNPCDLLLIFQAHVVEDEAVDVGLLFEDFCQGLATAVSGLGVDANEHRVGALMAFLQGGSKLKREFIWQKKKKIKKYKKLL